MDALERETYAIPVYSFDDLDGEECEARRPESESDDRIIVKLREWQTGPPRITAVIKSEGERQGDYKFRVTDEDLQWCAYTGDEDDVPVAVHHAIHTFGYGVENHSTLGQWYTDRWEAQSILSRLMGIKDEIEDPMLRELTNSTSYLMDCLDTMLVVRYGTDAETFDNLLDEYRTTQPDSKQGTLDLGPLKEFFWDAAHSRELGHLLGDPDGSRKLNAGVAVNEFEASGGTYLGVDIATDTGIERFLFHRQRDTTCAYVQSQHSSRPNPKAVVALYEDGYEVINSQTVAAADSTPEVAECGLSLVDELRTRSGFAPNRSDDPLAMLLEGVYDRLFTLFQTFAIREYNSEQYRKYAEEVRNHVGLSEAAVDSVSEPDLTELIGAAVQMMEDEAHEYAETRVTESPAYTDDLDKQVDGLGT